MHRGPGLGSSGGLALACLLEPPSELHQMSLCPSQGLFVILAYMCLLIYMVRSCAKTSRNILKESFWLGFSVQLPASPEAGSCS
jgi:hypothetical protein